MKSSKFFTAALLTLSFSAFGQSYSAEVITGGLPGQYGDVSGGVTMVTSTSNSMNLIETTSAAMEQQLSVFPNPAVGIVNLESGPMADPFIHFRIYKMQGELVLNGTLNEVKSIDISGLKAGMYFVIASGEKGSTAIGRLQVL